MGRGAEQVRRPWPQAAGVWRPARPYTWPPCGYRLMLAQGSL